MIKLPIDKGAFGKFVDDSDIFRLTQDAMKIGLENWYKDEENQFVESLRADFDTVMRTYHFYNTKVSFNKDFPFEPALDSITCIIAAHDEEGDYCLSYLAVFDYNLNIIDHMIF